MSSIDRLREILISETKTLVEEIGIRFVGTEGDHSAARYIRRRFDEIGLETDLMEFRCMGWKVTEDAELRLEVEGEIEAKHVDCFPYVYSTGTPGDGVKGSLAYWGKNEPFNLNKFRPFERGKFRFNKYNVLDGEGVVLAQIVGRDFPDGARAAPWGAMRLPFTLPTVIVGETDGALLRELTSKGRRTEVSLSYGTEFYPDSRSFNVLARLPGTDAKRSQEYILVGAHYDTQYISPGAGDNASGVACLLALAEYLKQNRPRRSVLFAAYGAEEIGHLGAITHFNNLRVGKQLDDMRLMFNLDMLSCNQPNWVHASKDFLAQTAVARAVARTKIPEKYGSFEVVTPPWPSGDQDPFYDYGIPCVSFTWKGYKYDPIHLPQDDMSAVDREVFFDSFDLARFVIEAADGMM